jgi:zinc protease
LALWLEADRMKALDVNSKNFENQRDVVKEERRQRVDNQPYSAAFLTSDTLSYDYLPYRHTVIGKMADLEAATVEDALRFYKKYYVPNNATLVIVGDVKTKDTLKMVEEYFGDIPRGEEIEPLTGTEPPHTEPRRKVVDDPNANVPAIFITYNIPETKHEDMPALSTLARILTDGEASRVHRRLVKEEEVAVIVWGGAETRRGPGLFRFIAASNVGVEIERCEELIYEEIDRLKAEGITDAELEKAKVQMKSDAIRGRETVMGKAEALHHFNYFYDDVSEINKRVERYDELTKQDIIDVANKYFKHEGRTVVICNPAPKQ